MFNFFSFKFNLIIAEFYNFYECAKPQKNGAKIIFSMIVSMEDENQAGLSHIDLRSC